MRDFLLFVFVSRNHLLKMHVAPGNRDLLPFWVFFGLKPPWPAHFLSVYFFRVYFFSISCASAAPWGPCPVELMYHNGLRP